MKSLPTRSATLPEFCYPERADPKNGQPYEALADATGEDAHAIIERALREIGQKRPSPSAPAAS